MTLIGSALALTLSLLLGGGTHSGFLSDAVLQLLSVPLFVHAADGWLRKGRSAEGGRGGGGLVWLCCAFVALHVVHLLPLPPAIWTTMPGADRFVSAFALLGEPLPWRPLSSAPRETWNGLLSILPPFTVLLYTAQLDLPARRGMVMVLLAIANISALLGLLQIAQGEGSALRFFEFTNRTEAVGFFANRNHFAALIYSATALTMAYIAMLSTSSSSWKETSKQLQALACIGIVIAMISSAAMARSRAGLGLMIIAVLAGFLLPLGTHKGSLKRGIQVALPALLIAGVFVFQYATLRIMDRFSVGIDLAIDARALFARTTAEAARTYLPFGSGMGSFVTVYGLFEKPHETFNAIANRAHNDLLEFWLEAGLPGALILALFLVWFFKRSVVVWSARVGRDEWPDLMLSRAASLVVILLLAHSVVDYPLRTSAMATVFAFACAMLTVPLPSSASAWTPAGALAVAVPFRRSKQDRAKARKAHVAPKSAKPAAPNFNMAPPPASENGGGIPTGGAPAPEVQKWGATEAWPQEWSDAAPSSQAARPTEAARTSPPELPRKPWK